MAQAGTTTQQSGQAHLATVYYNRVGLDNLVPKFRFYQACSKFPLPQGNGKTMQMWRDAVPGYNLVAASEGTTLSTPFVNTTATVSVTVEAYSDFMSLSTMMGDTSITDENARMIRALSIRAAGSVDTIIRTEIDGNTGSTTATISTNLSTADFKKAGALLEGINVDPFDGTRWLAIFHPYVKYDVIADTTGGGFIDSLKYASGMKVLNGELGEVASTRLLTTTNVKTSDSSTTTKYWAYFFGYQGVGICELDGRAPDGIVDPKHENFKINVYPGGGPWDATNEIKSVAGYRFVFAAKTLDANRFKMIQADSSIAS